jgi:hypothetical protein
MYAYIAASLEGWVTGPEFEAALRAAGFDVRRTESRLMGGIVLHEAVRRP